MSQAKFDKAVGIIKALPEDGPVKLSIDEKLFFYKYYKQATEGDINTQRPGVLDFAGKAKWDAWKSVEGTSKEVALEKYVEHFLEVLKKANNPEAQKYVAEVEAA